MEMSMSWRRRLGARAHRRGRGRCIYNGLFGARRCCTPLYFAGGSGARIRGTVPPSAMECGAGKVAEVGVILNWTTLDAGV